MSFGSALGQDRWIIEEVFPQRKGGYFIEAGALNGVDESNTVLLEREFGWNGLCVEPATAYFQRLKSERRCSLENACLYDRETEVEFVEAGGHGGIPLHFSGRFGQTGRKCLKPARTLQALLEKNHAPSTIEYLSLDTEGSELLILSAFPFERYRILAITVEHNQHPQLRDGLRQLLRSKGYVLCREVLVDDWWVHESHYQAIDEDRRRMWTLLNKFPLPAGAIRWRETELRYHELLSVTRSIPRTLGLLSRQLRKKLRGKKI